jgi:hypothetical protein
MTTVNYDNTTLTQGHCDFERDVLALGGADEIAEGTILARRLVALAVTASAVTGTGDGVVSAATVVGGVVVPKAGAYALNCVDTETHGGTFELVDPDGLLIATGLKMAAGAGAATIFNVGGLQFTVTDGAADFVVGDTATLTVAADGNLVPFSLTGAGGAQIPVSVMGSALSASGSGNYSVRPIVRGTVKLSHLVIDADGDSSNVSMTLRDQLRSAGILVKVTDELGSYDN